MFESVNRRILELKARQERVSEKIRMWNDAASELEVRLKEKAAAETDLKRAKQKVASLQGVSPRNLVASVLGNKFDALRMADDEISEANRIFEAAAAKVRRLEADVLGLKQDCEAFPRVQEDLAEAISAKEKLMRQTAAADDINAWDSRIVEMKSRLKELTEAVGAGKVAQEHLQDVVESLDSAAGWGVWDMLGGGLLATAVKHSRLDDAKDHAQRAGHACRRFAKELGDVNMHVSSSLEIDGFVKFADYFFDNLFTDWAVQSKIGNALEQAKLQASEVDALLLKLEAEQASISVQIKTLLQDKAQYIAAY